MNPFVHVGSVALPTYFTCMMVGFSLAIFVVRREAVRQGLSPRLVLDGVWFVIPGALLGARAAHILLVQPAHYAAHPIDALLPGGGFVFYGGVIGGVAAAVSYARHRGIGMLTMTDMYAPALAFGLVFGRLGCLGGGCCFGKPANFPFGWQVPWSVRYYGRGSLEDAMLGVPLHPAPLYAIALALCIFLVLSWHRGQGRRPGTVTAWFLVLYGAGRSLIEAVRGDVDRGLYAADWLSTSQIAGILSAGVALAVLIYRMRAR
jgi:phosphatidylglycerol:prolipoprotein diacylglycerol transferase